MTPLRSSCRVQVEASEQTAEPVKQASVTLENPELLGLGDQDFNRVVEL